MAFDRKKADEAANELSRVADLLYDSGLRSLSIAASDLLDRIEAVLEGDTPLIGDDE